MTTPLKPGDLLIYRPTGIFGRIISIKTWSNVAAHVEVAIKPGLAIAARGEGVNYYPTRWSKLSRVLRPNRPMDLSMGLDWFDRKAKGQRYDWTGLLRFALIGKQSEDKMFCSEMAVRFYRNCGFNVFPNEDADLIAPRTFLLSECFDIVWSDEA